MKKLLVAPIVVATLAASSFALAGGPDNMDQAPVAKGSVVFGVDGGYATTPALPLQNIGVTHTGALGQDTYTKVSTTDRDFAIGGHVGYMYNVMPKLTAGVQLGYLYLGQNKIKAQEALLNNKYTFKTNEQFISLLPTVNYNVYQGLGVFAQVGPALVFQHDDFASTVPGASRKESFHKVEGVIGAGVDYNIHNVIVAVAYQHLFGKKPAAADVTQGTNGVTNFAKGTYSANIVLGSVGYALPV